MMNELKQFYMVYRDGGTSHTPTIKHETMQLAHEEAVRLSIKHKGTKFYVLEAAECLMLTHAHRDVIAVNLRAHLTQNLTSALREAIRLVCKAADTARRGQYEDARGLLRKVVACIISEDRNLEELDESRMTWQEAVDSLKRKLGVDVSYIRIRQPLPKNNDFDWGTMLKENPMIVQGRDPLPGEDLIDGHNWCHNKKCCLSCGVSGWIAGQKCTATQAVS